MSSWPLTRRGSGLLAAAAACWLLGRTFGVGELAMAAVAMVALVVLAMLATRVLSTRLQVRRRISPTHLHHDQRASVEIGLRNLGRLPTAGLRVDDRAPAVLAASSRFATRPLSAGEPVQLRYSLVANRRGHYRVGPAAVELRDPFGIARRALEAGGTDEVVVYPRIVALAGGPPLAGHLSSGNDGPPRPGPSGDELANIREYVQGDDLRHVHWRSTAHRGKLMVRQEENRQRPEAVVLVDRGIDRHVDTAQASSFETMVEATASILWHLRSRQFRVRLVDRPVTRMPRVLPWETTMGQLATTEPDAVDVATLWQQLERGTVGEGSLVAVVPTPDPALLRAMVRAGRTFGARVALVVDPPPATRSQRFQRHDPEAAAGALRTAGWYATVLSPGDDLARQWAQLTVRSPRQRGPDPTVGARP